MSFKEEMSPGRKLFELIEKVVIVKGRLSTSPTVWEFHIGGEVLRIDVGVLENPKSFRTQYLTVFNRPAPLIKQTDWMQVLESLADADDNKMEIVEPYEESNNEFIARQVFEIICDREISKDADDAENGRCLYQHVLKKDDTEYYCMPSAAVIDIIGNAGFKIPLNELSGAMAELHMKCAATPIVWYNGKQKRSWCFIPKSVLQKKGDQFDQN